MKRRSWPRTLMISVLEVSASGSWPTSVTLTPAADSVSMTNRPKGSWPTRPTTPTRTPKRAKSTATFDAQPPILSGRREQMATSPAAGKWSIGSHR